MRRSKRARRPTAMAGVALPVLVPSALNAIVTAILSVCGAGDHLLAGDNVYEPTRHFCDRTLKRFGVETGYFAPNSDISPLLKPNTKAVLIESPGSLPFEVEDVSAVAAAAHAHG